MEEPGKAIYKQAPVETMKKIITYEKPVTRNVPQVFVLHKSTACGVYCRETELCR